MMGENRYSAEALRIREAVGSLRTPAASPAFRADLKRRFLDGTLDQPAGAAAPREARRADAYPDAPPARPDRDARPRPRRLSFLGLGFAAAAAVVLLIVASALNRGPTWQLADPLALGHVVIDGTPMALDDLVGIETKLRPGVHVTRPDSTALDLVAGDQLWVQIAPQGEVILPEPAGRWWSRTARAEVPQGEVRFTTGPAFAGARLVVETEIAQVELLGSTIAVIDSPEATCVCVLEGRVTVGPREGELATVPPGMRKVVYADGSPPLLEEILPMENMKLGMLRDRAFP